MFNEDDTLIILFSFTDCKKSIARFALSRKKRLREKTVSSLKQSIGREIKYFVTLPGRGPDRPDGKITDLNMA